MRSICPKLPGLVMFVADASAPSKSQKLKSSPEGPEIVRMASSIVSHEVV